MKEMRGNLSRGAVLAAVIAASVVAFALLGGVGQAQNAGLAQSQYGEKVTICHKGENTIKISTRAWPAHQRHGDTVGTCAEAKKKALAKKLHAKKLHAKKEHAKAAAAKKAEQSTTPVAPTTSEPTAGKGKGNGKSGKSSDKGGTHSD